MIDFVLKNYSTEAKYRIYVLQKGFRVGIRNNHFPASVDYRPYSGNGKTTLRPVFERSGKIQDANVSIQFEGLPRFVETLDGYQSAGYSYLGRSYSNTVLLRAGNGGEHLTAKGTNVLPAEVGSIKIQGLPP